MNKLKLYGIDTSLDKSPTLTIGINTKENYHQLFRVLKRLTINQEIHYPFAKGLFKAFEKWKDSTPSNHEDFRQLSQADENNIAEIIGFKKRKMTANQSIAKGSTIFVVYEGLPYRQRRIYVGEMNRPTTLPSGKEMKRIILITKEVAIFLNWLEVHFPYGQEKSSWKSIYKARTDQTYFGVVCHFIANKLDHMNAQYHRKPLDKIFNQFYLDYMVSYSGTMQRRVDERLRSESIATAYLTKKNIPEDVLSYMENTKLHTMFDYVEFDEDVDLEEIEGFERDVLYFKDDPLFSHNVSSLRIRKLGKHSSQYKTTSGLYYPELDNISIDLRRLSSFVHEWGHALDSYLGRPSTKSKVFLKEIHLQVVKYLHRNTNLNAKEIQYYSMPSEVFARAFEWYIFDKYKPAHNTAIKTHEDYQTEEQYAAFNHMKDIVKGYFSNLEKSIGKSIRVGVEVI